MKVTATPASLQAIQPYRVLFLHEGNFQFVSNSYHARGWTAPYLLSVDGLTAGYAALCGGADRSIMDTVFEFYIIPSYRKIAATFFAELLAASGATTIACQSNDVLLTQMLYTFANNINTDTILFADDYVSDLACNGVDFRQKTADDKIFEHKGEPEGDYVLEKNGAVIATGGFLLHYNMPYADLYMEVNEPYRRKGYGGYLIQEIKIACYQAGRVPAARCNISNSASQHTLLKAGFKICGYRLEGNVKAS